MGFILIMFTDDSMTSFFLIVREENVFKVFFDYQESGAGVSEDKEYNIIKDELKFLRLATD